MFRGDLGSWIIGEIVGAADAVAAGAYLTYQVVGSWF